MKRIVVLLFVFAQARDSYIVGTVIDGATTNAGGSQKSDLAEISK